MTERQKLEHYWKGGMGVGLRALLSCGDASNVGAWLWFEETVKAERLDLERLTIGEIARFMLIHKLSELLRLARPSGE